MPHEDYHLTHLVSCSFVQGLVFRTEGAVGVALVNAVRGSTVSLLMGTLFCSSATPARCLHAWTGASAAVQTAGGLTWLTAGRKVCKHAFSQMKQYQTMGDVYTSGMWECALASA